MDDDYELVSKEVLARLKKENSDLKAGLGITETGGNLKKKAMMNNELVTLIKDEAQKDREMIISNLNAIKDLNKSTLDNLLQVSQKQEAKISDIVETMTALAGTISELVAEFSSSQDSSEPSLKEGLIQTSNASSDDMQKVLTRLEDIEKFMGNLKVLLAGLKPNDISKSDPMDNFFG